MEQDRLHVFNHLLYNAVTTCVCLIPHVGPEEHKNRTGWSVFDFKLPQRRKWGRRSSEMLRSADW